MKRAAAIIFACSAVIAPATAQQRSAAAAPVPFTATLSNTVPLVFGMTAAEAAAALNAPLTYIRGKPGDEVFAAPRPASAGYFNRNDQVFLQFRQGRLTGWKGDWGRNWMWE